MRTSLFFTGIFWAVCASVISSHSLIVCIILAVLCVTFISLAAFSVEDDDTEEATWTTTAASSTTRISSLSSVRN